MQLIILSIIVPILLSFLALHEGLECKSNIVMTTITVDGTGLGNFKQIQAAIDSIPPQNSEWIRIQVLPGDYYEKVIIPKDKGCIYFEGSGANKTSIKWGDHFSSNSSATFTSNPENIVVRGISFENFFRPVGRHLPNTEFLPSVAITVSGDKSAFYDCNFGSLQDTLADMHGRHYFNNCFIKGGVDFIYGYGQSIYEGCRLVVNIGTYGSQVGTITAQGRDPKVSEGGFVFKNCQIYGYGKVLLGRAWNSMATVIFSHTHMGDVVDPKGWDSWNGAGHEADITFAEVNCTGPGADMSHRVTWEKTLGDAELQKYLDLSFIDQEGWIAKLPIPKLKVI